MLGVNIDHCTGYPTPFETESQVLFQGLSGHNMELIHGNQNLLKKKKLRVSKLISSMPKKPQ